MPSIFSSGLTLSRMMPSILSMRRRRAFDAATRAQDVRAPRSSGASPRPSDLVAQLGRERPGSSPPSASPSASSRRASARSPAANFSASAWQAHMRMPVALGVLLGRDDLDLLAALGHLGLARGEHLLLGSHRPGPRRLGDGMGVGPGPSRPRRWRWRAAARPVRGPCAARPRAAASPARAGCAPRRGPARW